MSDRVVQSYHDTDGMTRQAMKPYQSSWMAHWMRSSCKSANEGCSHLSICHESQEVNHDARQHHFLSGPEVATNISKYPKGFCEVTEAKTANIVGESLIASTERLRSDRLDCQSFPVSSFPEKRDSIVAEKNGRAFSHLRSQVDLESRCFPFSLGRGPDAETSSRECHFQPERISQHLEQPVKFDKFVGSNSTSVAKSLQDDFMRSTSKIMPHGCNSRTPVQSICDKSNSILASEYQATTTNDRGDSMFLVHEKTINMPGRSKSSLSRQNNVALLPHDISKSIQQHDFVDYGLPAQSGVKLQLLRGSTSSEGEKDVKRSAVNLNNESSADTDTMDMDIFQENHVSGMTSSPTNKCIELDGQTPTSQPAFALSGEEIRDKLMKTNLPDINQELPNIAAFAASVDDRNTSTSRTQSLDVEHLLSNAEQSKILKSSACTDVFDKADPSRRWVKRLKLNPTSARGTKSSEIAEASSRGKVHKFFSKNMKCNTTSSEPTMDRCQGKEHTSFDQTASSLRNSESSSIVSKKENQDIKLSHPWIRRWCHNVVMSPPKKSKAVGFCKPQCSKAMLDKVQKKHHPSLAAMALMGKAISAFSPCEITKSGSFVVWNSK